MMRSYFRAVNDAPPSMRSKNRQSPAAKRATVTSSTPLTPEKAAAQSKRLRFSSASMERKLVGFFRLRQSDISVWKRAMAHRIIPI